MKICVTGAGGFIGSQLAEKLAERGHEVRAFLRYNSKNSWGWLEESEYAKEMEILSGDIRDFDLVRQAVQSLRLSVAATHLERNKAEVCCACTQPGFFLHECTRLRESREGTPFFCIWIFLFFLRDI